MAADEGHSNEKNVLSNLYPELEQYSLSRGFELQLCDLHESCADFLDPKNWVEEPLEARGGHHLAAMCLSEISSNLFENRINGRMNSCGIIVFFLQDIQTRHTLCQFFFWVQP